MDYINPSLHCCGFKLKTGAKIIGTLHTVFATVIVLYTSYLAHDAGRQIGSINDMDETYTQIYHYMCIVAATGSVHILLGTALLVGVCKHLKNLVLAWTILMTLLYIAAIIFIIVVTLIHGFELTGWQLFIAFIEGAIPIVFIGYCILCVSNYYQSMKEDYRDAYSNPPNMMI